MRDPLGRNWVVRVCGSHLCSPSLWLRVVSLTESSCRGSLASPRRYYYTFPRLHRRVCPAPNVACTRAPDATAGRTRRSEEHTSELQSRSDLVCRLLLEK